MASSLFCLNQCQFDNCGLYFASLCDLVQHIEEDHIPIIENERRKRDEEKALSLSQASPAEGGLKSNTPPVGPALPLSSIYRLFPVLPTHRAQPIKYEPTKISFYHYRKKQVPVPSVGSLHYSLPSVTDKARTSSRSGTEHDEEMSNDSFRTNEDDGDTEPNDDRRHKCPVDGCNKRYKNLQGARYHARTVHGLNDETASTIGTIDVIPTASGGQSPITPSAPPISKAATIRPYKCSQCSKRYKTVSNLNKHVQETHQRVNPNYSAPSLVPNLAPISPATVPGTVPSPLYQTPSGQESPVVSVQGQGQVSVTVNHVASGPLPGVRVTAQPVQSSPSPTTGSYHFHQPTSYTVTNPSSTIQVRTVSNPNPRTSANIGPVITYGNMVDGSQQTEASLHVTQQRQLQRMPSGGSSNVPVRNAYSNSDPV